MKGSVSFMVIRGISGWLLLWWLGSLTAATAVAGEEPFQLPPAEAVSAPAGPAPVAAVEPAETAVERHILPYTAHYEVSYSSLKVGEMTQRLQRGGDGQHVLQTTAHTTGVVSWLKNDKVTEESIWYEAQGELLPLSYRYRYQGRSKDVLERLDFDWQAGEVESLRDGKLTTLTVTPGTYDKHMYQIALRRDLAKGERRIAYSVAERSKIKSYAFEVVGEEHIDSESFGSLDCLRVKKGTTTIWVAPDFDYLPVRIEKDEDGSLVRSELVGLQRE